MRTGLERIKRYPLAAHPVAALGLAPMSTLLEILTARGFVQGASPGLAARLAPGPVTG